MPRSVRFDLVESSLDESEYLLESWSSLSPSNPSPQAHEQSLPGTASSSPASGYGNASGTQPDHSVFSPRGMNSTFGGTWSPIQKGHQSPYTKTCTSYDATSPVASCSGAGPIVGSPLVSDTGAKSSYGIRTATAPPPRHVQNDYDDTGLHIFLASGLEDMQYDISATATGRVNCLNELEELETYLAAPAVQDFHGQLGIKHPELPDVVFWLASKPSFTVMDVLDSLFDTMHLPQDVSNASTARQRSIREARDRRKPGDSVRWIDWITQDGHLMVGMVRERNNVLLIKTNTVMDTKPVAAHGHSSRH
ncbi:hypothetical protein H0H92_007066 [Tricholoma furcatifolium]|nr:hypothetical protein H0H92_007066 [Tricholoma furcatifolium]